MPRSTSLDLDNVRSILQSLRQSIGQNIRLRRQTRKITLRKLSLLTGIKEDALDQFELGKSEIRLEHIVLIATALRIHPERLL